MTRDDIEKLYRTLQAGQDGHKELASKLYNVAIEDVTVEQRKLAKAYAYTVLYGLY